MHRILGPLVFGLATTLSGLVLAQGKLPLGVLAEADGIPTLAPVLAKVSPAVVSIRAEIEPAFWSAVRVTLVGSMTPAFTRSSNTSVAAL